ncbi:hypothetical protein KM043_005143 [Ampulex compressa]|nr:hypothetical protein KM043_005143 [Ampulex compressa]
MEVYKEITGRPTRFDGDFSSCKIHFQLTANDERPIEEFMTAANEDINHAYFHANGIRCVRLWEGRDRDPSRESNSVQDAVSESPGCTKNEAHSAEINGGAFELWE